MIIITVAIWSGGEVPLRIAMRKFIYLKNGLRAADFICFANRFSIHILTVNISIFAVVFSALSAEGRVSDSEPLTVTFSAVIVPL